MGSKWESLINGSSPRGQVPWGSALAFLGAAKILSPINMGSPRGATVIITSHPPPREKKQSNKLFPGNPGPLKFNWITSFYRIKFSKEFLALMSALSGFLLFKQTDINLSS